jgi:hypothetical protein
MGIAFFFRILYETNEVDAGSAASTDFNKRRQQSTGIQNGKLSMLDTCAVGVYSTSMVSS